MRKEIMVGGMEAAMPMSMPLTDVPDMNNEIGALMVYDSQYTLQQRKQELMKISYRVHPDGAAEMAMCNQCPEDMYDMATEEQVQVVSGGAASTIAKKKKPRKANMKKKQELAVAAAELPPRDVLAEAWNEASATATAAPPSPPSPKEATDLVLKGINPSHRFPGAEYEPPPDSRPEWDLSRHGAFVTIWHTIAKNAFKALIGLILSNQTVAGAATAFTVSQLFGTLDKLLITLISVGIGTACAGIATYTGAAVAGVSLYTILRSAYGKAAGLSREQLVSNVAASCYVADANLRNHVTTTAQEIGSEFLNSPTFIELLKTINASVDHVSSALAGLFVSRFVKKMYRPPPITPDAITDVTGIISTSEYSDYYKIPTLEGDPWLLAKVRTKTQTGGNTQFIPLFDIWGCISIPAIHKEDDVPAEQAGRVKVQAVLDGGMRMLAVPEQIRRDNDRAQFMEKQAEIQNAFAYAGYRPLEYDISTLGRYVIEGLHDYFTLREIVLTSDATIAEKVTPDELKVEIDLFLTEWDSPQSVLSDQEPRAEPVQRPPGLLSNLTPVEEDAGAPMEGTGQVQSPVLPTPHAEEQGEEVEMQPPPPGGAE